MIPLFLAAYPLALPVAAVTAAWLLTFALAPAPEDQ